MSSEQSHIEKNIPPRPSKRPVEKFAKRLGLKSKAILAAGILLTGAAAADYLDIIDLPGIPEMSINPGQAPGKTTLEGIDVDKFRASSTDALGEATVKVDRVKQVLIDKPEPGNTKLTPHETRVYNNGRYTAQWVVAGVWKPELQKNGDLLVTLPAAEGKRIITEVDPIYNDDASDIAFGQWVGSLGGASTSDDIAYSNTREALTKWVKNPKQSGSFHKAVSCVALAGAAGKAEAFALSTPVNIEKFTPARAPVESPKDGLPTIRFQIPDPSNKDKMLTMESCLTTLDGMNYNPKTMATSDDSATGLATHHIKQLVLPEHIQN